MQFNHTLSAIMRGKWLIDKQWADAHMPMVLSFMKGEAVDFGFKESIKQDLNPTLIFKSAASAGNVYGVSPGSNVKGLPGGSIVMVNLTGPMIKNGGLCSYGMVDQAQLINQLSDADNVEGIILNIDSPGGQADGTALLSDVIKNASAKKPIISIINDGMAASAAMWIASATNEIYVTQSTDQVGSIGVYTQVADWNKYYKDFHKLDIKEVYAPQSTDKNKDYRDSLNGDDTAIQEDLSVLADQFINTVAENRSGKIKGDKWKTGKMFYAKDAMKYGLIDGIKSFDQVVQRMNKLINYSTSSQNKNSNNMAFTKTIKAAKAESFAVVEGGFLLEESNLNNIETALTNAEVNAAALEAANANAQTLSAEIATLKADAISAKTIADADKAKIVTLEAKVAELGAKPSGSGSTLNTSKDDPIETEASHSYAGDDWADKQLARRKKTAV